jgi:hypothetical protein
MDHSCDMADVSRTASELATSLSATWKASCMAETTNDSRTGPMHPSKDIQAKGVPSSAGKMSETNYLSSPVPESLQPFNALGKSVHQVLAELQKYISVIERRESLALNLGMPLRGSILCDQLSKLFTVPRPSTVDGPEVSWANVVLTLGPSPEHFDPNSICKIGDSSIKLAEEDYLLINSGRPWRFLSPWPDRKDCELELGVTNTSLGHVTKLGRDMAAGTVS